MKKRGQLSIFVIISIAIIVIVIAAILIKQSGLNFGREDTSRYTIEQYTEEVNSRFMSCFENESKNALNFIALQGGHYKNPGKAIKTTYGFIPYYIYLNNQTFVNNTLVEQSISYYINEKIVKCVPRDYGDRVSITVKEPKSEIKVNNESVIIKLKMPVIIENANESRKIEDFSTKISSNITKMIEIANWLSGQYKNDSEMLCTSCLDEISAKNNVYTIFIPINSSDSIVSIVSLDNRTVPERFNIAHKYIIWGQR